MKISQFKSKKDIESYIKQKFGKQAKLILIRGSTAYGSIKFFSDLDFEIYTAKIKKPYYELVFINKRIVLISIYFYKFKEGKKIKEPKNVKIIRGEYNDSIIPNFTKDRYNGKEKIKRECQLCIDFMFKYLRSRNKKSLESVQRRLK